MTGPLIVEAPPAIIELECPPDPVAAFERVLERREPFLLDGGCEFAGQGRYSFLGCDPFLTVRSKNGALQVWRVDRGVECSAGNPFDLLDKLLAEYAIGWHEAPVPFCGGAVGYFAYDLCHHLERLPRTTIDDLKFPDLALGFYDTVAAWDRKAGRAWVCALELPGHPPAEARVASLAKCLTAPYTPLPEPDGPCGANMVSNFDRRHYIAAVTRAIEYIHAGDIFQVNLSQRFSADLWVHPWQLYRRCRASNPAPFAAYLGFADGVVASHSPERFLRVENRCVTTRPIKGTRPRGQTPAQDAALAKELLTSEKDRAELVMIVDLERNDLGRVCSYGSVRVPELLRLESYATVHHLVSTVVGHLHESYTLTDLLKATFPGGSITGAPKVRSMEIIDELEPTQRSVYTGSLGWIGFNGDMDLNIVIRTYLIKDGRAHWQVGGGIVADSDPAAEYEETLAKGLALKRAMGV
ncbi:MAG: aminodeoxychorismate synthase, component I [Candidatus Zipacnadales bacterium]